VGIADGLVFGRWVGSFLDRLARRLFKWVAFWVCWIASSPYGSWDRCVLGVGRRNDQFGCLKFCGVYCGDSGRSVEQVVTVRCTCWTGLDRYPADHLQILT